MKKIHKKYNKKNIITLGGALAIIFVFAGGGYYLSTQQEKTQQTVDQGTIEQNLESKEKQIQENDKDSNTHSAEPVTKEEDNVSTNETITMTTLTTAKITGVKDGTTVILSAYGISQGKYEVEKNGQVIVAATNYAGHGGLPIPNLGETSARYQIFLISNGVRTAASKIITVSSSFTGTKEFTGV